MAPHNLPMTVLGAAILWFGWFGFNAGSALAAGGLSAGAFVATHLAASAATLSWVCVEWVHRGKRRCWARRRGCVAGLVGITPGAGFVAPMAAIVIGLAVGAICYGAVMMKGRFGYDDSLDVVGVHFVGGMFGALATGLFATKAVNPAGADGLFYGNPKLFLVQALAAGVAMVYAFCVSYGLLVALDKVMGLRVEPSTSRWGSTFRSTGRRATPVDRRLVVSYPYLREGRCGRMAKRILFLLAHPDDETFGPGGTIAKYAREGHQVHLLAATRGEAGMLGDPPVTDREHLGEVRSAELEAAAAVLGAAQVHHLGFSDGKLAETRGSCWSRGRSNWSDGSALT
jgi:hypothetical protein